MHKDEVQWEEVQGEEVLLEEGQWEEVQREGGMFYLSIPLHSKVPLHVPLRCMLPFLYAPSPNKTPLTVVLSKFTSCPKRLQHKIIPYFYM